MINKNSSCFFYFFVRIIERHTIVNRAFTIEQLKELSSNSTEHAYPIQAIHGTLRIETRKDIEERINKQRRKLSEKLKYIVEIFSN